MTLLDSHDACRYLWVNWRIMGMNPTKRYRGLYWCYSVLINLIFTVLHPLHLFLQLFFITDFLRIVNNLSITLTLTFATMKQSVIFYYSSTNLREVKVHLAALDRRAEYKADERVILEDCVRFCHRMYYVYNVAYCSSLTAFAIFGYFRHTLVFEGWFPFDWTTSQTKYFLAYGYQVVGTIMQIIQNLSNDIYASTYAVVMVAHFRVLNLRISKLGKETDKSREENVKELVACIEDHEVCMRFYECVRPVISRTMFLQFLITAFVLCNTAVSFFNSDRGLAQLFTSSIYLGVVLTEVTPCCWFVNELIAETDYLTTALYNSNWYEQSQGFRKNIIIFMQRSQKATVILAGDLAPVTLQTLLAVIKFSFSMFTILSK